MATVFGGTYSLTYPLSSWSGRTLRQIFQPSVLTAAAGGSTFAVRFEFATGTSTTIGPAYIGHPGAGDPYDFDGSQVQLTFDTGASTKAISGATVVDTDSVSFAGYNSSKNLVISLYMGSGTVNPEGYGYVATNSELTTWINVVGPSNVTDARKSVLDTLISGLKTDGVWSKLDRLWLLAAENAASAAVDIKAAASGTVNGGPTFVTDRGYQFDGTSTKYINSNFNPGTAGGVYGTNSAHLSAWSTGTNASSWDKIGNYNGTNVGAELLWGTNQWYGEMNDNTQVATGVTTAGIGEGLTLITRVAASGSGCRVWYNNGSQIFADAVASTTMASFPFFIGSVNSAGTSTHGDNTGTGYICSASIGGALTATDASNFYTRMRTYMTSVGVP